jgi:hypothetical protein
MASYPNPASTLLFLKHNCQPSAQQFEPYLLPPPTLLQNTQPVPAQLQSRGIQHRSEPQPSVEAKAIDLHWASLAQRVVQVPMDAPMGTSATGSIVDRQVTARSGFPPSASRTLPTLNSDPYPNSLSSDQVAPCRSMSLDEGRVADEFVEALYRPASWSDAMDIVRRKGVKARKSCSECGTMQTCQWRRGPNGTVSLCNACGIRYRRARNRQRPLYEEDDGHHAEMDTDGVRENEQRHREVIKHRNEDWRDRPSTSRIQEVGHSRGDEEVVKAGEQPTETKGKRSNIYMLLN